MLEIPLNAKVDCIDGHAGKSTHVIIDPRNRTVTHIVVKGDKNFAAQDRLVPIEHITSTTQDVIQLNCTLADVEKMPPFSAVRYVNYGFEDDVVTYTPDYIGMGGPYSIPTAPTAYVPLVDEALPQGERALMQGARVEATDGTVGKVGDLIINPETGQITHFTLQEGNFWGKREISLPLSAVDHAEEDAVHLKLDKKAIHSLPSVPRGKAGRGGDPVQYEFIARIFDAPNKAADALAFVKDYQFQQRGAFKVHNSAILVKDADGKLTVTESGKSGPKKGTVMGAIAGGLLGALAGPVGIVIGAAAGAGIGRATTRWQDLDLPDEFVKQLQGYLQPNTSALIILIEHQYLQMLIDSMADIDGIVMQHTLTDAVVERLLKEQGGDS